MVGAIVLNDYTPGKNIEMTGHSNANWSPKDVRDIARYCFGRVRRITARTSMKNEKAIKMLEAIGFKREGVLRDWFDDADAIVFGLLRSEQRIYR
ncbi:GNAT family N-acetyltransferase [Bradyrhizobium japonicum]|uniref:GNAT family N-acetyltransferase n=1 Tax=Bradyrhizobium japonicum TaxID=375 RepID=UPI00200DE45F|nr:GNAT family protein [Bradyrhizobium japonicum]UQD69208.1 GNAT family N-acetyltransferase [Bradyrhizobium japonicum]WAX24470.1 GNAT family N-acetyltransferase [Bradyrhizobium phage ppBjS10J-1]